MTIHTHISTIYAENVFMLKASSLQENPTEIKEKLKPLSLSNRLN